MGQSCDWDDTERSGTLVVCSLAATLEHEGGGGGMQRLQACCKGEAVSDWVKKILFSLCYMRKYGTRLLSSAFELERELYVSFTCQEYR